eukprot:TRINITY_DN114858_c0_g1_i1.p1 TRINITY_DN114858_c0_g1~~TRINITY_DN114858_c0_g1_i1.p1  ORF type:complete len:137 (+),score=18.82 TRINITY_DN114858_c0_g1_i1:19-429(+)
MDTGDAPNSRGSICDNVQAVYLPRHSGNMLARRSQSFLQRWRVANATCSKQDSHHYLLHCSSNCSYRFTTQECRAPSANSASACKTTAVSSSKSVSLNFAMEYQSKSAVTSQYGQPIKAASSAQSVGALPLKLKAV